MDKTMIVVTNRKDTSERNVMFANGLLKKMQVKVKFGILVSLYFP